ncbi:hypothetical protein ACOSQ3_019154 [Xanthoceras sorbifolium]
MGNWRNRPPRKFFYRQRPPKSPPSCSLDLDISSPGFHEDGVPLWEKKFCTLIGRVPWQKIVDTKKFMYGCNVLDWDDSAGNEAFQNAKKRFWAEINGLPCDISLPDPDIYIDEINWNPDIDPELIRDLASVYFAPDEGEKDGRFDRRHNKYRNFTYVSPKGCSENSGIINNPWDGDNNMQGSGALKDGEQGGWDQSDNGKEDVKNIKCDDNPWESNCTWGNEVVEDKVQGWNQWDDNNNVSEKLNNDGNPWESSCTWGNEAVRDNTWGSCDDKSWGLNQGVNHDNWSRKWDNGGKHWDGWTGYNHGAHNYNQYNKTHKDRGGRDCRRGNAWGFKQWDNSYNDPRNAECGLSGGGWRTWNENCRKREGGSHQTSYKNSGPQRDHNQAGHSWRGRSANKRVSFAL